MKDQGVQGEPELRCRATALLSAPREVTSVIARQRRSSPRPSRIAVFIVPPSRGALQQPPQLPFLILPPLCFFLLSHLSLSFDRYFPLLFTAEPPFLDVMD